eukprot:TRINITY_DN6489_c0_g2_i1.p2 TRINITY_DN6489_c0_g2~~TRINITY_DN6489_c0_g2_i1.p2  ORF type:complete len:260 (-),score=105.71 TRINITY_DN6489_c0_g2_i1:183-962(-)
MKVERALSKEESRLASLKFQEQGREKSIKHLEEVTADMAKEMEKALEKQKEYEEEQSYNKATQMKLLQSFDQKMFKKIKDELHRPEVDAIVKETVVLFVSLLNLKLTATDAEIKDCFSEYKKTVEMMQDRKLEDISSVDENQYLKTNEVLKGKMMNFGNDKAQQEHKDMCSFMLHFAVFTIGISMAKRNLERGIGRLEKMQRDYTDKEAERAKKIIHAVDIQQIKLCEEAVSVYKSTISMVLLKSNGSCRRGRRRWRGE